MVSVVLLKVGGDITFCKAIFRMVTTAASNTMIALFEKNQIQLNEVFENLAIVL